MNTPPHSHGRTIEDEIATADDAIPSTRDDDVARYPWSNVGDDAPHSLHDRRFEHVILGEQADVAHRRSRGDH